MERRSVFETLASQLSTDERKEILSRLGDRIVAAGDEPLSKDGDEETIDLEEHYRSLNLFQKIVVFFRALFSGQDRILVLERHALGDLARKVNAAIPGLVDSHNEFAGGALLDRIQDLRDATDSIAVLLRACSGADKAEFLVFLAGIEMGEFQELVESRTDPYRVAEAHPDLTDVEVKRRLDHDLDDLLSTLPAEGRQRMYQDAQLLYMLQQLLSFRFEDVTGHFSVQSSTGTTGAPFAAVKEGLGRLASLLLSMTDPPNPAFVESLVIFANRDRLSDSGDAEGAPPDAGSDGKKSSAEFEQLIEEQTNRTLRTFDSIRKFIRRIPIRNLMRCVTGNLSYRPETVRGGEDWFAVVRRYWRDYLDGSFRRFVFIRKRDNLLVEGSTLLESGAPVPVHGYPADRGIGGNGRYGTTLSVAKGFFTSVYPLKINRPFKTILIDGEFYKEMNRTEFADSYGVLDRSASRIRALEEKLKPDGDFGAVFVRNNAQPRSPAIVEQVLRNLDAEVSSILESSLDALRKVSEVVNGILYGEVGGRYDTLSNLGYVGGRMNKEYLQTLDEALRKCKDAARIIGDLYDLESLRK
ncbi:MAG TPA: DUF5312 family protein [Spirochaetia bacterium]|nr:DUF5312 family protein [Spirochaetia bacterium]